MQRKKKMKLEKIISAHTISLLRCPICATAFDYCDRSCKCKEGHHFDFSADGYLHLLPSSQMHNKNPGDNKQMMQGRHDFLSAGYYCRLREAVLRVITDNISLKDVSILDIGCGEGYYTHGIACALQAANIHCETVGIDLSKIGLRYAAKRFGAQDLTGLFLVASAYHLPLAENSFDVVTNIFSPLSLPEIHRVLKKDGLFLYVVPAARHLWQMKEILYQTPYENEESTAEYEDFSILDCVFVSDKISLNTKEEINALFSMTPYYWKSPKKGVERLMALDSLQTEIAFRILVYKKVSNG